MKNRNTLEAKLYKFFNDNIINEKVVEDYKKFLMAKGYTAGEIMRVFQNDSPPDLIGESDLFMFTLAVQEVTRQIKVSDYFYDKEIDAMSIYRKVHEDNYKEVIIFHNVDDINGDEKQFTFKESIANIVKYADNFCLGYDLRFQRESIKIKSKRTGVITEKVNINKNKVKEIASLIESNNFFNDPITLCVYRKGNENIDIDKKNNTLTITLDENTKIKCPDGQHRIEGFREAVHKNPNIQMNTSVKFLWVNEEEIGRYILQIDRHTPLTKSHAKMYDVSDIYMKIAKDISTQGAESTNEMHNRMVEEIKDLKIYEQKYCTYETISRAIEYNFNVKKMTTREARKIGEFIVAGLNEIIGIVKELEFYKTNSVCYDNMTFVGYIAILAQLYGKDNWLSQVEEKILKINFARDNKDWETIELANPSLSNPSLKQISNYFIERSAI